jgi:hypothetical protein
MFPRTSSWTKNVYFQDVDKWCWEWNQPCHTNVTCKGFVEHLDHVCSYEVCVISWTTMTCHVYDPMYCKMFDHRDF